MLEVILSHMRDNDGPFGFSPEFWVGFWSELFWFTLSALILSFLLPRVIEYREFKKQRRARRMIAARVARTHKLIFRYAKYIKAKIENNEQIDPHSDEKVFLGNALHHLMEVPKHFSVALRGNVADAYFEYRILITCGSGYFATKGGDYNGIFQEIFFSKIDTFEPSPDDINKSYKKIMRVLGGDVWKIKAIQPRVPAWTNKELHEYREIVRFFEALPDKDLR